MDENRLLPVDDGALARVALKTCSRCKAEKPLTSFNLERRKPDGRSAYCKPCKSAVQCQRQREVLRLDPDWRARKRAYAQLAAAVARGDVVKPTACPVCARACTAREMQAQLLDEADPTVVRWLCRYCAVKESGRSYAAQCLWCGEPMEVQRCRVRKGGGRYCSITCRSAWMAQTAEHVRPTPVGERTSAERVYMDDRW